jgi:hypothetical protein
LTGVPTVGEPVLRSIGMSTWEPAETTYPVRPSGEIATPRCETTGVVSSGEPATLLPRSIGVTCVLALCASGASAVHAAARADALAENNPGSVATMITSVRAIPRGQAG